MSTPLRIFACLWTGPDRVRSGRVRSGRIGAGRGGAGRGGSEIPVCGTCAMPQSFIAFGGEITRTPHPPFPAADDETENLRFCYIALTSTGNHKQPRGKLIGTKPYSFVVVSILRALGGIPRRCSCCRRRPRRVRFACSLLFAFGMAVVVSSLP